MLSKCANPGCDAPFQYLREGKLFRFDMKEAGPQLVGQKKPSGSVEFFWLCGRCASEMTLGADKERGVIAVPVRARARRAAAG